MAKNNKDRQVKESGETERDNNNRSGGTARSLSDQDAQYQSASAQKGSGKSGGSGNSSGNGQNKAANPSKKDSHR